MPVDRNAYELVRTGAECVRRLFVLAGTYTYCRIRPQHHARWRCRQRVSDNMYSPVGWVHANHLVSPLGTCLHTMTMMTSYVHQRSTCIATRCLCSWSPCLLYSQAESSNPPARRTCVVLLKTVLSLVQPILCLLDPSVGQSSYQGTRHALFGCSGLRVQ